MESYVHRRFSIGVLAMFLASTCSDPSAADAGRTACTSAPTRACVLDWALDISREISDDSGWRVHALISIARAQAAAGRSLEAAAASDEAAQVLNATKAEADGRWRATALGRIAAAQARAGL